MNKAYATYEIVSSKEAIVTVDYPNGRFGMQRVAKPRLGALYDAAYAAADLMATMQGFRLERFARE
jgi:hypothetical protein